MFPNAFHILQTNRLILRQILESDADEILFLRSDAEVNKFIYRPPHRMTKTKKDAIAFIQKINLGFKNQENINWGIVQKDSYQLIGSLCLWNFSEDRKTAETGYDLNPEFQGKGIMSEALAAIIDFGFTELNLNKIEAFTHRENESSKKLLLKNGFEMNENRLDEGNENNVIFEILQNLI